MTERLKGKVALVTGALGGFGRAITLKFIAEGAKVVAVDVSGDPAGTLKSEFGDDVQYLQGDHSVREYNEYAVAHALDT